MGRTAGQRLEEARKAADLTTTYVGKQLGLTQQQYSSWEKGTRIPDKHRARLAEVLGLELTTLLSWIAAEEQHKHDRVRRTHNETVKVMERFVDQYLELGHSYQAVGGQLGELIEITTTLARDLTRVTEDVAQLKQDLQTLLRQPRR